MRDAIAILRTVFAIAFEAFGVVSRKGVRVVCGRRKLVVEALQKWLVSTVASLPKRHKRLIIAELAELARTHQMLAG